MESNRNNEEFIAAEEDILYDEWLSITLLSNRTYGKIEEPDSEGHDDNESDDEEKPSKGSEKWRGKRGEREGKGGRGGKKGGIALTHFFSIPLNLPEFKTSVGDLQAIIRAFLNEEQRKQLRAQNLDQIHITLGMLPLSESASKEACKVIFDEAKEDIKKLFVSSPLKLQIEGVSAFWAKKRTGNAVQEIPKVIYLKFKEDEHFERIIDASNILLSKCVEKGVLKKEHLRSLKITKDKLNRYRVSEFHVTVFRVKGFNFDGVDMKKELEAFKSWQISPLSPISLDISTRFKTEENGFYLPFARLLI